MKIRTVGVIGSGLMGSGIAQVSAQAGCPTTILEVSKELLDKGMQRIQGFLDSGVDKGKLRPEARDRTLSLLKGTTEMKDLSECDLVIEAITENLSAKRDLFSAASKVCSEKSIFASNTSSLSITEIMTASSRPERFLGLHFFNPVPLMKLVEVVRTIVTQDEVESAALEFVRATGKTPIRTSDRTGFIVNRLLVPYILDAIRALENGVGSIEEIDAGMRLGCGYPMGPFTLLDFVGLDTTYYIAGIMFDEFKEARFAAPPLLKRMVLAGTLGRKSGKGFYDYSQDPPVPQNHLTA
ncbi:MAG: 3-hydroxyacyl-CoA dehydrogenase family protein [Acidobacteria bacterium]|nr:3-hydroxyacyl-CoA dehydrogenase family protein [Acidobacteriota bacterium]MCI0567722.1 3-hydroxyacyl-CoA dehydrogenase family protein [Acidobacteriota bacterium]